MRPAGDVGGDAETRAVVEAVWRQSLGLEGLDGDGNFFVLGGDSLSGMAAIAAIQERLGVSVTFADLLDAPTVDQFAALLPTLGRKAVAAPRRARPRLSAPMTRVQLDRWKDRRSPVGGAEVYWLYRLEGHLDVEALRRAVDELVRRHDILRTTFRRRWGRPRQVVQPWKPGYLRVVQPVDAPRRRREEAAVQLLLDEDYRAFDYERGPLIRPTLVEVDERTHLFSLACCEMVVDGSSRRVLATALSTLYEMLERGEDPDDYPFPPVQFADIALARRALVGGTQHLEQVAYWRKRLRAVDPLLPVAALHDSPDRPPETVQERTLHLNTTHVERVEATARRLSATPFAVLGGAFAALLAGLNPQEELVFTTTLAHRDVPGGEDAIGAFYNNVFLIVDLRGIDDGRGLVAATAAATRASFRHGDVPLPQAQTFLPRPDESRPGLRVARIRFQLHEDPGEMRFGDVRVHPMRLPAAGGPDLGVLVTRESSGGLALRLLCRGDIPRAVVEDVLPAYRRILLALCDDSTTPFDAVVRAGLRPQPAKARK